MVAKNILRLLRTVRHLKLVQILYRFRRYATAKPRPLRGVVLNSRTPKGVWVVPINKPASILTTTKFRFLNREESVLLQQDWNRPSLPKLWLYNLHYHDWVHAKDTDSALKQELVLRWISENPFCQGNGWEPYPISIRIVNWIKWQLSGTDFSVGMEESLYQQAHVLSRTLEYHLLGNHLIANAKALVFAGLYFGGNRADEWLAIGRNILERELPEQFLLDGGHFELSTTYHAALTEDLLDLVNVLRAYGKCVPVGLTITTQKALDWLTILTRPDGFPPLFNDAAYGISPTLTQLQEYAGRLTLKKSAPEQNGLKDMSASGYFRFDGADYSFWGDAGQIGPDYIPGHGHCDMLSFELFAHGAPIVVDGGTSTYEVGERRHRERSTAAHNTVQVGRAEQSEIWSSFRVGRRARIVDRRLESHVVEAAHDGYRSKGVVHKRRFEFSSSSLVIEDYLQGSTEKNEAVARFHLHPDVLVRLEDGFVRVGKLTFLFSGAEKVELSSYEYAPEFYKLIPAQVLEISFQERLRTEIQI